MSDTNIISETIIPDTAIIPDTDIIPQLKKRKLCETNACEFIVCAILLSPVVSDKLSLLDFINNTLPSITNFKYKESDIPLFIDDILSRSDSFIKDYIHTFREKFYICKFTLDQIDTVYLTGKSAKFLDIIHLNHSCNSKLAKADVYIKLNNSKFIGLSIKQSQEATKSNYSVHKMLPKDVSDNLNKIKLHYLISSGFPIFKKEERELVNQLFYDNNPYFDALKLQIDSHKDAIIENLVTYLFSSSLPYDMYEFDGVVLHKLNNGKIILDNVMFYEHMPFYLDSKGNKRNCAKLFYKLDIKNSSYRVEIRWKGNVFNSSPQFQIHAL